MKNILYVTALLLIFLGESCRSVKLSKNTGDISGLRFIGEYVFPEKTYINNHLVGGFSGIDFTGKEWILISDDVKAPIRYYTASFDYDLNKVYVLKINAEVELKNENGQSFANNIVDPEAIRFDKETNTILWTSEGNIKKEIDPALNEATKAGMWQRSFVIPPLFKADSTNKGPRHNGVFEGLSISSDNKGYWISLELPLKQDGEEPIFDHDTESPVRFLYFDKTTGKVQKQLVYELEKVARKGKFTINGVSEILAYQKDKFLVIERSYAQANYKDGGNNIVIFKADARQASDVSAYDSLKDKFYRKMNKTRLFDFETIRHLLSKVPDGSPKVDNIEGISFGPLLPNGHRSLVVVADNNFSAFGEQLSQFIVFEVIP